MPPILRGFLAVLAGIVTTIIVMIAIEAPSYFLYPLPEGLNPFDSDAQQAMQEHVRNLPMGAFLIVLAAWGIGTFVGCWVAARIAVCCPLAHAGSIGALFLAATVYNLMTIEHPQWVAIAGVALISVATLLGGWLGGRRA